jgi:hypothetical protein
VTAVREEVAAERAVAVSSWWRLWAIAALAHVIGNPAWASLSAAPGARGIVNVAVGLVALSVVGRPDRGVGRVALAVGIIVSAWFEAPVLGNHWLLAAAVSGVALLAGIGRGDIDWWDRFAPTARIVLLVGYSFAAFAKVNTGFLDATQSCAVFLANRTLSFWQLPQLDPGTGPAAFVPIAVMVVELAVPVLLLVRRTRRFGVVVAVVFHVVLTLDLPRHFFDFTTVLVPLFLLFAPPAVTAAIDRHLPRSSVAGGAPWYAIAAAAVVSTALPRIEAVHAVVVVLSWPVWLGLAGIVVWTVVRMPWRAERVSLRPVGLGWVVVGLVVLNGLTPYLELKTATAFNMYSNLMTGSGDTNHLLVPGTLGLRDDLDDLAIVLDGEEDGLGDYVDSGFALPMLNLRDHLAEHDEAVVFDRDGQIVRSIEDPTEPGSQPWWQEKLLLFRAVPIDTDAPVCQHEWLPAG